MHLVTDDDDDDVGMAAIGIDFGAPLKEMEQVSVRIRRENDRVFARAYFMCEDASEDP